jgi:TPR repeat protein
MTRALVAMLASAALVWACTVTANAGPFEEGVIAYERNDHSTALRHWRPLAEQGNPAAQSNLALMYARGQGVPRDYVRAYMWSSLAASKGHADGVKNRSAIAKGMTPAQIQQAQKMVTDWKPTGSSSQALR